MSTRKADPGPLGRRINYLRWRMHISREELAAYAKISVDLLKSLEQGRARNPTLKTLQGLSEGLGVSISELLSGVTETCEPRTLPG